jgi:hypothetical protein
MTKTEAAEIRAAQLMGQAPAVLQRRRGGSYAIGICCPRISKVLVFNKCGARGPHISRAAYSLHRLTHERPATGSPSVAPTQRWCSDWGKGRVICDGQHANRLTTPLKGTWSVAHRSGLQMEKMTATSHPAEPMESRK